MELFKRNRSGSAAPLRGHYCAFVPVLRCHDVSFFMLIKGCAFCIREISFYLSPWCVGADRHLLCSLSFVCAS